VYSAKYPACNARVSYSYLRSARCTIFFQLLVINGTIFAKTLLEVKFVWWFIYKFFEIFLILRRIERDIIIHVHTSSCKINVILFIHILLKLEFSRQVLDKYRSITFHEILSSWSRVVPRGRANGRSVGHTDMTKQIVALRLSRTLLKVKICAVSNHK
jgi:hypothetical protein